MKLRKIIVSLAVAALSPLLSYAEEHKTMAILGDSYSTFQDYVEPATNAVWYFNPANLSNTDVKDVRETWWQLLAMKRGYKIGVNNSYSGATICRTGYNGDDYTDRAFITRMSNVGAPDLLFIFGATNDSWANAPVGEYKWDGWTPVELFSFRPAMARLADYVMKRYPNVEKYFILNCDLSPEITESVEKICAHYGLPVIKLHDISKQSGHPDVRGMAEIADQIDEFLSAGAPK